MKCSSRCDVCKCSAELLLLPALCVGQACMSGGKWVNLHRRYSISVVVSAYECCVTGSVKAVSRQQLGLEVLPVLGRGCLMHGAAYLLHSGHIFG